MRVHYDKIKDALYIRFDENPYNQSQEIGEGIIFDYDEDGRIIGIEVLGASKKLSPSFRSSLIQQESLVISR